jgi:Leucine-rich repeat (LRR) protein
MINAYRLKTNLLALLSLLLLSWAGVAISSDAEQKIAARLALVADPTFKHLWLSGYDISPQSALAIKETLERFPLISLSLRGCSIDSASLQMLFDAACSQPTITDLDLSHLGIDSSQMEKFCSTLRTNTTLRALKIALTPSAWAVVDVLEDNTHLESLNLSFCACGPGAATCFIKKLTTSRHSLKQLSLSNNALTVVDVPFLQEMIRHHTNLQSLDLSGNKLENLSGNLLDAALETKSITSLDLSNNNITDIVSLNNYLILHKNLKKLFLENNNLSAFAIKQIAKSLGSNASVPNLNIGCNKRPFDSQDWQLLAQGLEQNTTMRLLRIYDSGLCNNLHKNPFLKILPACEYVEPNLGSLDMSNESADLVDLSKKIFWRNRSYDYFVKALSLFIPARIENSSLRFLPHEQLSLIASYLVPFKNNRIDSIEKNGMRVAPDRLKKAFTLLLNSRWREQVMENKQTFASLWPEEFSSNGTRLVCSSLDLLLALSSVSAAAKSDSDAH